MTTDELIAKLLDGTLTTGELNRLQSMMEASPELAEEVRHLRTIEDMLTRPQEEQTEDPAPFLHSVEDRIAASLVAAGGATSAAHISSLPRALFAPIVVLIGSIGVFLVVRPGADAPAPQPVSFQTEIQPSFEMRVPSESPDRSEPRPESAVQPSASAPRASSVPAVVSQQPKDSTLADVSAITPPALNKVEQSRAEYDKAVRAGDKFQMIFSAYRLGLLYQDTDSREATVFLKKALELSRETKLQEYEAKSLGQLGLIARKEGNTHAADAYLRDCISLLERLDNAKLLKEWREHAGTSPR